MVNYKDKIWLEEHYIKQNMTCAEIGKICGVSPSHIWKQLKRNSIETRKDGQRPGYILPEEVKQKISEGNKGKPKSVEHRRKLSESKKGCKHPNFGKKAKIHGNRCWYKCPNGQIVSMRSNWEAAYANYLDVNRIEWEYEPKTFVLSSGRAYTPDFFLPNSLEYVEVKGWLTNEHKDKIGMFIKEHPEKKFILANRKYLQLLGIDLNADYGGVKPKFPCKQCNVGFYKKYPKQEFCCHTCSNKWTANHRGQADYKNRVSPPKRKYTLTQTGVHNNAAKLTNAQVLEAVRLRKEGLKLTEISNQVGITPENLSFILKGKSWSHLTGIKYNM